MHEQQENTLTAAAAHTTHHQQHCEVINKSMSCDPQKQTLHFQSSHQTLLTEAAALAGRRQSAATSPKSRESVRLENTAHSDMTDHQTRTSLTSPTTAATTTDHPRIAR